MASSRPPHPRWSSQTIDTRKPVVMARLMSSWEKVPQMRLGELVTAALADHLEPLSTLAYLDDDTLLEAIERYVLTKGT